MKDKDQCLGCIGFDEPHTCDTWADFLAMEKEKNKCHSCGAKDKRIEELEADLKDYATAIGQNEQLRKENERLTTEVSELKQTIATLMWLEEQARDDRLSNEFIGLRYRQALWEFCEDGYMRRGEAFKRWYTRQNTEQGESDD